MDLGECVAGHVNAIANVIGRRLVTRRVRMCDAQPLPVLKLWRLRSVNLGRRSVAAVRRVIQALRALSYRLRSFMAFGPLFVTA